MSRYGYCEDCEAEHARPWVAAYPKPPKPPKIATPVPVASSPVGGEQ